MDLSTIPSGHTFRFWLLRSRRANGCWASCPRPHHFDVVLTARGLDFLEAFPADLRATFPGKQPEEIFQLNRKASGEDGRFRFGQLYGGRWEITAETPDGRTMTEVVEAPRSDLRLIF